MSAVDVHVSHGGGDPFVAEQFLDGDDVHAAAIQRRRAMVPQHVRAEPASPGRQVPGHRLRQADALPGCECGNLSGLNLSALSGINVSGLSALNLSGLSGINFSGLSGLNLSGLNLSGLKLSELRSILRSRVGSYIVVCDQACIDARLLTQAENMVVPKPHAIPAITQTQLNSRRQKLTHQPSWPVAGPPPTPGISYGTIGLAAIAAWVAFQRFLKWLRERWNGPGC